MKTVSEIAKKIKSKKDNAQEVSYYSDLEDLIEIVSQQGEDLGLRVLVAPRKKKCGFPDIQIFDDASGNSLGFIEVKLPHADLSENGPHKTQFSKYKESASNLIITDIGHWQLWQWNDQNESVKKFDAEWNFEKSPNDYAQIRKILELFHAKEPIAAEDPEELAKVLAHRNKRLAEVVEEIFNSEDCPKHLKGLYSTIKEYLIRDIDVHDYANMFAETITYTLFIARLQHHKNGEQENFTIDTAFNFLHRRLPRIPLLDELYNKANEELVDKIETEINLIVQDLKLSDFKKIYEAFTQHDPDKDPVIYFYEPFVKYNDPETKIKRGVFYTPKPIANFITRSINVILKKTFGFQEGLANENVHLLDPAMGTGTFLVAAIERIYEDIKEKFKAQGPSFLKQKWEKVVQNHILENFYGFEILLAPYAIAHLKLSLYLEEIGFQFDKASKNKKFKLYLTNTLENEGHIEKASYSGQIVEESRAASIVKNEDPVLIITGNPPYSVSSFNKGKWIENLMNSYKTAVRSERNIQPLSDDYIKFIRFGQWKIGSTGNGVFGMITNHSFLDGLIHRGMREELMKEFDQIYVLNLHGNKTVGEIAPYNKIDENVFDIKQGVSISFFVKSDKSKEKGVWYQDLWGSTNEKLNYLNSETIESIKWQKLTPEKSKYLFFIPINYDLWEEYEALPQLSDIFEQNTTGVTTGDDEKFVSLEQGGKFKFKYSYHPFDDRFIDYENPAIQRNRGPIMEGMSHENLGFALMRKPIPQNFNQILAVDSILDKNFFGFQSYIFPLFTFNGEKKQANFKLNFLNELENRLKMKFISNRHDEKDAFGPEDVFYYLYAILYSDIYRLRYQEELRFDFPRIPITSNKKLFQKLAAMGKDLVEFHQLNKSPFCKNRDSIIDDSKKWRIGIFGDRKNWLVSKVVFKDNKIYINEENYFKGITEDVWNFCMGGNQVLDKWLKSRKGRELSFDEQVNFIKICVALRETINTVGEVDSLVIDLLEGVVQPQAVTPKARARQTRRKTVESRMAKRPAHAKSGTGAKSRKRQIR